MARKDSNGQAAEDVVTAELRADGWDVLNLNREIAGNYPVIDLIARSGSQRVLVQVRGCGWPHGDFMTPPDQARKAETLGDWLGWPALYAFVHFSGETPVIRYETATRVADLAKENEANYQGTNLYHTNISDFTISIRHLRKLLGLTD